MALYDIAEGSYDAAGATIGIVAARFNARFVDRLLEGALTVLHRHGVTDPTVVRVPGAFEIPLAAKHLAGAQSFEAIITLGAVVRGETPHFDYVAGTCAQGVMAAGLDRVSRSSSGSSRPRTVRRRQRARAESMATKGKRPPSPPSKWLRCFRRIPR